MSFWRGDHAHAAELLLSSRAIANAFGGSHAQRDIIDLTLAEAVIADRDFYLARAFAHQRHALKPMSRMARDLLARSEAIVASRAA